VTPYLENTALKDFSYYRTGGPCERLYLPRSVEELQSAVREICARGKPFFLLGGGTNSLVTDEPWPGDVIGFRDMQALAVVDDTIIVGAGVENSSLAEIAFKAGLNGVAWMNGLPGQLGGTIRMNARCYGGEISQVVTEVIVVTSAGEVKKYTGRGIFRGYKDTIFMNNNELIAGATLQLRWGDANEIRAMMDRCIGDRRAKGQYDFPSCGCVFKNDYSVGVPSGRLLDAAEVKTLHRGSAAVSEHHANFVFNKNNASAEDILQLSQQMREKVYKKFGVWLEYEMEVLGWRSQHVNELLSERRPRLERDLRATFPEIKTR
jgi:UDP-N-acetylmuramate dehydrogenase